MDGSGYFLSVQQADYPKWTPFYEGKKKITPRYLVYFFFLSERNYKSRGFFFSPVVWGVKHETPGDFAVKNCFSPIYDGDFKKKV
jgi:hypothetical protein